LQTVGEPAARTGTAADVDSSPDPVYEYGDQPSPVVLRLAHRDLVLRPWTYCWSGPTDQFGLSTGVRADGTPDKVADLPDAGRPDFVRFWFGVSGWEFQATFRQLGEKCPRQFTVYAASTGDHMFRLDPAGPAGRYQVDVFGRGNGGDVITSFVWTTGTDRTSAGTEAKGDCR
jgi:hypothetical protein